MTLPGRRFTYEEYKKLPDDQRYEVLAGELEMTPAPTNRHQRILIRLTVALETFTQERGCGTLLVAPTDVILSAGTVLQPDLLFVSRDRQSIIDPDGGVHGAPNLVIEIISPATAERDLVIKRQLYGMYGVQEYWIVDPEAISIEVLTYQGAGLETWERFLADGVLTSPALPGLQMKVSQVIPD
jgi:Uma2 family endonuclease